MEHAPDEQVLDPAAFKRLREFGGAEFLGEMIDRFMQYVPGRIAAARDALAKGDLPALAAAAHPVKSSAGHIGARRMSELALRIEEEASRGGNGSAALFENLVAENEAVMRALAQARQDLARESAASEDKGKGPAI
jgi:HPt (histidine-containing phosphotransfer) domain-containing protein